MSDTADDGSADTESTATRYRYTNDLLAGSLVAFAIGATATYVSRGDAVPLWLASVLAVAILTAVVWTFGTGAFAAARRAFEQ